MSCVDEVTDCTRMRYHIAIIFSYFPYPFMWEMQINVAFNQVTRTPKTTPMPTTMPIDTKRSDVAVDRKLRATPTSFKQRTTSVNNQVRKQREKERERERLKTEKS